MTAAVVMMLSIPYFSDLIPKPAFFSILAVLLLVLLSGYMSPKHKAVIMLTVIVSAIGFLAFEYYAVNAAQTSGLKNLFFAVNQFLAIIFLFAAYFGTKSIRWLVR